MNGLTRAKTNQRLLSERMLATFDGNTPGKPIYIAVSFMIHLFELCVTYLISD
jgi:hypothetical protein